MADVNHARDEAELGFLMQYLREAELPSQLLKPSNEVPLATLLVPLFQDYKNRDRFMTFTFVPLPEDEIEYVRLLQIFSVVPVDWKEGTRGDVEKLLLAINARTAIGHFNVNEEGEVSFRYVHAASNSTILPKNEILETIDLFNLMLDMFAETIDKVASGAMPLSEALASV